MDFDCDILACCDKAKVKGNFLSLIDVNNFLELETTPIRVLSLALAARLICRQSTDENGIYVVLALRDPSGSVVANFSGTAKVELEAGRKDIQLPFWTEASRDGGWVFPSYGKYELSLSVGEILVAETPVYVGVKLGAEEN